MRQCCVWLVLAFLLGLALQVETGRAADQADADSIDKLVKQLSSGRFAQREAAQKKLEEIGLPALSALKKAAEEGDAETKRRAGELADKIEKKQESVKVLTATKLKLSYKDTPLKEALEDLTRKTGYRFALLDPENKLKDRKITLETSEVTFWEAFDQFCAKAGLVEADPNEGIQGFPQPGVPGIEIFPPQIQPVPGIQIQPGGVIIKQGIRPAPVRVVPPAEPKQDAPRPENKPVEKKPVEKNTPAPKLKEGLNFQLDEKVEETKPAEAPAKPKVKPQVAKPVQIQVAPAQPPQVAPPLRRRPIRPQPVQQPPQGAQFMLKDGAAKETATDYSGAVRIQAVANAQQFGAPGKNEILFALKVSPEPKLRWQQLVGLRIDKALDDQGQTLMPGMAPMQQNDPNVFPGFPGGAQFLPIGPGGVAPGWVGGGIANPFGFGGIHQYLPVRLTKGEKASKTLKEFSGVVTARILAEPEVMIEAPEIMKAAGKTFKGKQGGQLKVVGVEEKDGNLIVRVEFDQPRDVVPAGQPGGFQNPFGGFNGGGGIQILPVPLPAPAPALPPGAFQVQVAPAKAQAQVQIQIQQIQIGGGPVIIGGGFGNGFIGGSPLGLELVDEKGNVMPSAGFNTQFNAAAGPGGQFTPEHHLYFRPQEGQKASKLVFKGSKSVSVEIPFKLKDVKLP